MIDAAVKLVAQKGLDSLTLAAVGVAAGYSRGLPTHHFKSRAALVAALTDSIAQSYVARVQTNVPARSPLEDLLGSIEHYLGDVERDPVQWRSFMAIANAALTDKDAAAALSKVNARAIAAFERRLRAGIEAGQIRADLEPRAEAALILATLRGLAALSLTDPKNQDFRQARAAYLAAVRDRLQKR